MCARGARDNPVRAYGSLGTPSMLGAAQGDSSELVRVEGAGGPTRSSEWFSCVFATLCVAPSIVPMLKTQQQLFLFRF